MKVRELLKMSGEELRDYFKEYKLSERKDTNGYHHVDIGIDCIEKYIVTDEDSFPLHKFEKKKLLKKSGVLYICIDVTYGEVDGILDIKLNPVRVLITGPEKIIEARFKPQYKLKVIEGETSITFQDE